MLLTIGFRRPVWRGRPPLRLALVLPLVLAACESESLKPKHLAESEIFWRMELNHHAIMLSTAPGYNTLALVATPYNVLGEPLAGLPAPQYTSTDFLKVVVSSDGVLQALEPTSEPVWVRVTLTTDNLKYTDSTLVSIVAADPLPVLTTFSIHPVPPDSAKIAIKTAQLLPPPTLPVRALDEGNTPIDGVPVHFRSSDPEIATIHPVTGEINGLRPGEVTFYASTTAFGVSKADTLPFRIGLPLVTSVGLDADFNTQGDPITAFLPSEIRVPVGGVVLWQKQAFPFHYDVTFLDADLPNVAAVSTSPSLYIPFTGDNIPSLPWIHCAFTLQWSCGEGNIVADPNAPTNAARLFPVPGTYEYHSTIHGVSGRIIVVDES
jgi:plastocyanin